MTYDCSLEVFEFFSVEEQNIQRDVEKRLMNILVIGNGFDLAHGLPTKYGDFLNWVVEEYELYESLKSALKGLNIKLNIPDIKKKKQVIRTE